MLGNSFRSMTRGPKFFLIFGDPGPDQPRRQVMLQQVTEIRESPSSAPPPRVTQRRRTKDMPALVASDTTDPAPWTADMLRVRDHRDREAFARLFGHFAPRVKGFLMKSGTEAQVAEDCAQDVMVTVWNKAHLYDPARASVATWVFTIARNRRIDVARRDRRPEPEDLGWGPEPETAQEDSVALQQETDQLSRALAELPERQRELIEKCYFGDLSHREIADVTGLPLGTIKSRIRLALDKLRHAMG